MSEKMPTVNLDQIFPKDVMERVKQFSVHPQDNNGVGSITESLDYSIYHFHLDFLKFFKLFKGEIVTIIAWGNTNKSEELARVRVKLSLQIEIIPEGE